MVGGQVNLIIRIIIDNNNDNNNNNNKNNNCLLLLLLRMLYDDDDLYNRTTHKTAITITIYGICRDIPMDLNESNVIQLTFSQLGLQLTTLTICN